MTIRPVAPDEHATLFSLFSSVRADELAMDGWDEALRNLVLKQQFDAQRRGHRAQHPAAVDYLILLADQPIGWTVIDRTAPTWHCVDIAIASAFRRRGIATDVLRNLQREAASARCAIGLMVLHSNTAARALYDGLGFRPSGAGTPSHIYMEWRA